MNEFVWQQVLPHFGMTRDEANQDAKVAPLGNGHINDTFLVRSETGDFVLQRLNTQVFPTPWGLVGNAGIISEHLCAKRDSGDYQLQVVCPHKCSNQELGVDLGEQGFWRAISYLPYSHSIDVVESAEQAEIAAHAFGHFARSLSDLDANQIHDVIPKFHFLPGRIEALREAAEKDPLGRVEACREWVEFALGQTGLFDELRELEPKLPLRICHNDTKINNMLFDKRDMSAMAIIDLDTCMKGHLMYDFGDMVRTFCSPEAEDSTELNKVLARPEIFAALAAGYTKAMGEVLTDAERQSLWLGARIMPLMIGVRFLTDHLLGDTYFHIHRDNHNLDRAANQFSLYQSLLAQEATLKPMLG
ncbi:aminoglycoside phosphotransferase family protein [Shewanella submarina]|uniref:Phosphotransferase enzyme family protein n=1 Tax=Shewanella submarina TaxID=2016376 RepID=A0ABV7GG49_9GAMM|nr:aminoglycoside phosphotransferase family protein [Shewanella submarina]